MFSLSAKVPNSLTRIIEIYEILRTRGEVSAYEMAARYQKTVETIKRDIKSIRNALPSGLEIRYDRIDHVYRMEIDSSNNFFPYFMLLTILYGSRSLQKEELNQLAGTLFDSLGSPNRGMIRKVTESYAVNYVPMIKKALMPLLKELFQCIRDQRILEFAYTSSSLEKTTEVVAPLSIAYDKGFFYLIAYKNYDSVSPELHNYRIDRMDRPRVLRRKFVRDQNGNRFFEAGWHFNHSFLMHSGTINIDATIKVKPFLAQYLEPAFPIHQFLREEDDDLVYKVTVTHEESLLFWLLSQRTWAEVLAPQSLRSKMKSAITDMVRLYEGSA